VVVKELDLGKEKVIEKEEGKKKMACLLLELLN